MAFALAYYYRNSVEESEIWRKSDKAAHASSPIKMLFTGENLKSFLQVFVVMTGFWLLRNASLAVMPGLLAMQMKVGSVETTSALVIAYLALSVVYVLGGVASQLIGRRTYLLVASVCTAMLGHALLLPAIYCKDRVR